VHHTLLQARGVGSGWGPGTQWMVILTAHPSGGVEPGNRWCCRGGWVAPTPPGEGSFPVRDRTGPPERRRSHPKVAWVVPHGRV